MRRYRRGVTRVLRLYLTFAFAADSIFRGYLCADGLGGRTNEIVKEKTEIIIIKLEKKNRTRPRRCWQCAAARDETGDSHGLVIGCCDVPADTSRGWASAR